MLFHNGAAIGSGTGATARLVATDAEGGALAFAAKRCLDVALALAALFILAPVLLLIAITIALDSRGPVVFVQERVGARRRTQHGQTVWEVQNFPIYKFR